MAGKLRVVVVAASIALAGVLTQGAGIVDDESSRQVANRVCIQQEIAPCNLIRCGSSAVPCRRTGPAFKICMAVRCVGTSGRRSHVPSTTNRCYRNKCNY